MTLQLEVSDAVCGSLQQHGQLCYNASSNGREQQPVGCDAGQRHVLLCCCSACERQHSIWDWAVFAAWQSLLCDVSGC
jgi:hypothetical protein